LIFFIFVIHCF